MSNYLILGSQGQISSNFIKNFIDVSNDKLILVDRVSPIKTNEVPNSIINFTFDITKKKIIMEF